MGKEIVSIIQKYYFWLLRELSAILKVEIFEDLQLSKYFATPAEKFINSCYLAFQHLEIFEALQQGF